MRAKELNVEQDMERNKEQTWNSYQHPPEPPFEPRSFPVPIAFPAQCPKTAPDAVLIRLRPQFLTLPDAMKKHIVY